jgi:hypothetical protein
MDDIRPLKPRRFDDVARPGEVPASPSSKPVIVGNKTVQNDPMMAPSGSPLLAPKSDTKNETVLPTYDNQIEAEKIDAPDDINELETVEPPEDTIKATSLADPEDTISSELVSTESEEVIATAEPPEVDSEAEPLHKLHHEQPIFGEMKPVKSRGKKVLIILLTLIIMGAIGYGGWLLMSQKPDSTQNTSTPAPATTKKDEPRKDVIPANFTVYESKELGLRFSYPKEWGNVKVGPASTEPQFSKTDYKQLIFSAQSLVDINVVQGPYSSPLDGCGLPPLKSEKNQLDVLRASNIGWDKDGIVFYGRAQGEEKGEKYTYSYEADQNPGYTVLLKKSKSISFQEITSKYKAETEKENSCFDITQKEADEANSYHKYIHFASNFETKNIKGINAQYDARIAKEQTIIDNIFIILNSFTKL